MIHHAVSLFFANMMGKTMQRNALGELDQDQMYRALPLISALDDLGENPYYRGVIEHEQYGEWWDRYSLRDRYDQVETPSLFITGWFDSLLHETLKVFNGWTRSARTDDARKLTKLVVGPWSHQVAPWGREPFDPVGRFEELEFGPQAAEDIGRNTLAMVRRSPQGPRHGNRLGTPDQVIRYGSEQMAIRE